jgi:isopentenyldiphosphate isomerase
LGRKPWNKKKEVLDSLEAVRANAELIESPRFIEELNRLLGPRYFNHEFRITDTEAMKARAIAYYIQKRLTEAGRSDSSAWLATSTEDEEKKGLFTPPQDMFNRTLEGVAQTMLQEEYFKGSRQGKGIRIVNEFAYEVLSIKDEKEINEIVNRLLKEHAKTIANDYFAYVLKAVNEDNAKKRSELREGEETSEMLDVVDENDELAGKRMRRAEAHRTGARHRAAVLLAFNRKGELLIQKRGQEKDVFPDTWTFSASGHVEAGATYAKTILKEAPEEMGIPLDPQRLNVIGATGMPWSSLKQYTYTFSTRDVVRTKEAIEKAHEQLVRRGVLPVRNEFDNLLWRVSADQTKGQVTVFLYQLNDKLDAALDRARGQVGAVLQEMVGKYEQGTIINRDNRTHYAYRLNEQEEEALARRAEEVRLQSASDPSAEVTDLQFASLEDIRQRFREHPTLFVEDMLILFDRQLNQDLEATEDLLREAKAHERISVTAGLSQSVQEVKRRLQRALQDPREDFDAVVLGVNPAFANVVSEAMEGLKGIAYNPALKVAVVEQDPEGSVADSLSATDTALRQLFGDSYGAQMTDKKVAMITMSGFGGRMPTDLGKGLLSLPGGRTYLEQVLRQRFFFLDKNFRGLMVLSIDGIKIPQYIPEMGKAGIQVIGLPMARTDENVGELGLFVIDEPFRTGAQPIRYAFEKLPRSQRDDYVARQLITGRYVNVSEADYPLSWDAFTWLLEQTQTMRKMLAAKHKAEGKPYRDDNVAYNWAEHLFELAFLPEELIPDYLERSVLRSGPMDKDIFDEYLRIARAARERFGMEFVNVGTDSVYHNTNRPDQYRDFLISLLSNEAMWDMFDLVGRDGKIVDRQDEQVSPAVFSSPVEKGVLISKSIIDLGVQMKKEASPLTALLLRGPRLRLRAR